MNGTLGIEPVSTQAPYAVSRIEAIAFATGLPTVATARLQKCSIPLRGLKDREHADQSAKDRVSSERTLAQARRLAARMESSGPMTASEWDWTLRVFDHVQLNASDYTASVRFYETVLSPLGIPKIAEHEQGTWSSAWTDFTDLNVLDRRPPTTNLHLCFYARSKEQVDAFHRAGVEAGFRSNGAPGYRDYAPGYYAAYLLDPDGNNVEALYRDVGNIGHGESAALH